MNSKFKILRPVLIGVLISTLVSLITNYGIEYYSGHPKGLKILLISLLITSVIAFLAYISALQFRSDDLFERKSGCFTDIFLLIGILIIVWTFPSIIILWLLKPTNLKSTIRISIFLISALVGTLYFILNKEKFPSSADKVTYFSGILLGPVAIYEILIS